MNNTSAPLPQDWLESGVDPEIIRLNVEAVTGEQAFELIYGLSAKRCRRGGGSGGCFRELAGYNRGVNKKGLGANQVPRKNN